MTSLSSYYCLDFGNTDIKVGIWNQGQLSKTERFKDLMELFHKLNPDFPVAVSSVLNKEIEKDLENHFKDITVINSSSKIPFTCSYLTPETLGIDRICNAAALSKLNIVGPKLSIDIGTCVKFDFLNERNEYEGGSISPGLNIRFKALNEFTANLPFVDWVRTPKLIGKNTFESIQSGVQIGMLNEITGMIEEYQNQFPNLTIFMTGGDLQNFDFPQKNNIFADDNLTLKGISEIYKLNATIN